MVTMFTDNLLGFIRRPCLYQIANDKTGDFYLGSTWNFHSRVNYHWNDLKKNRHHNLHLQRAFNRDKEHFRFAVLEWFDASKIDRNGVYAREQEEMDRLRPAYNLSRNVIHPDCATPEQQLVQARNSSRHYILTPPGGGEEIAVHGLKQFCRWLGFGSTGFHNALRGEATHCHGWKIRKPGQPITVFESKRRKALRWVVTSPNGIKTTTDNLTAFCREISISYWSLVNIAQRGVTHKDGWQCERIGWISLSDKKPPLL